MMDDEDERVSLSDPKTNRDAQIAMNKQRGKVQKAARSLLDTLKGRKG